MSKKKIIFVTSTRADYGKLKSIILKLQKDKKMIVKVFVTGSHNMNLYAKTVEEIKKDKIKNLNIFKNQGLSTSMSKILINTIRGFSNYIEKERYSTLS